jgi:hypothetical protein
LSRFGVAFSLQNGSGFFQEYQRLVCASIQVLANAEADIATGAVGRIEVGGPTPGISGKIARNDHDLEPIAHHGQCKALYAEAG